MGSRDAVSLLFAIQATRPLAFTVREPQPAAGDGISSCIGGCPRSVLLSALPMLAQSKRLLALWPCLVQVSFHMVHGSGGFGGNGGAGGSGSGGSGGGKGGGGGSMTCGMRNSSAALWCFALTRGVSTRTARQAFDNSKVFEARAAHTYACAGAMAEELQEVDLHTSARNLTLSVSLYDAQSGLCGGFCERISAGFRHGCVRCGASR
jgi:hypothetical protein